MDAEYIKGQFNGNNSGYTPICDRILVKVDESASVTAGGVHIPDETAYKMTMASETGVIVSMGDAAFIWSFDRSRSWEGYRPKIGDRIYIERYAGRVIKGKDGIMLPSFGR
jgi:co-chaperonin GroES (HSP10)